MKTQLSAIKRMLGLTMILLIFASFSLFAQEKMKITTSSDEARMLYDQGIENYEMFKYPMAIKHFSKAVETDPEFALAHLYLSLLQDKNSKIREKHLQKAVDLKNQVSEGEKHMILYVKASEEGDDMAMKKHIKALELKYPEDERVISMTGMHHYNRENYSDALSCLKDAVDINNLYHPAYNMLGYTYWKLGKMEDAENSFLTYIELVPDIANSHDSYASFLKNQGKFKKATEEYKMALNYDPKYPASLKGLGDIYLFKGSYGLAREYYKKYAESTDNDNNKFYGLLLEASVELHNNNAEEALAIMDKYIQMAEKKKLPYQKINAIAYKGYILTETGRPEEGLEYYMKASDIIESAEMSENLKDRMRNQAQLWKFYALTSNDNMPKAEQEQKICKQMLSEKGSAYQWRRFNSISGLLEIKKGNYEKARNYLAEGTNNPTSWYYTGLAWDLSGNTTKAHKYYQKVINYYENSLELGTSRNKAMAWIKE